MKALAPILTCFLFVFLTSPAALAKTYKSRIRLAKGSLPAYMYGAKVTSSSYHRQLKRFFAVVEFRKSDRSPAIAYSAYTIGPNESRWSKIRVLSEVDSLKYVSHTRGINGHFKFRRKSTDYIYEPKTKRVYRVPSVSAIHRTDWAVEGITAFQLGHLKRGRSVDKKIGVLYLTDLTRKERGTPLLVAREINKEIRRRGFKHYRAVDFRSITPLGGSRYYVTFHYEYKGRTGRPSGAVLRVLSGRGIRSSRIKNVNLLTKPLGGDWAGGRLFPLRNGFLLFQNRGHRDHRKMWFDRDGNEQGRSTTKIEDLIRRARIAGVTGAKLNVGRLWRGSRGETLYEEGRVSVDDRTFHNKHSQSFAVGTDRWRMRTERRQQRGGVVKHFIVLEKTN